MELWPFDGGFKGYFASGYAKFVDGAFMLSPSSACFAPGMPANVCRCLTRFWLMSDSCLLSTLLAMRMIDFGFVRPDVDNPSGWMDPP